MDSKATTDTFQTTHKEITVVRVKNTLRQGRCRSGLGTLESDSVQFMFELLPEQQASYHDSQK
jgi:hypothetical protein